MPAYFDHNATTPLCPAARAAWLEATERHWHNPSSLYREAGLARQALEAAREALADLLGAEPERVVFTSGGVVIHVVSLRIEGGVRAVYMTLNPDKLSRWSEAQIE